MVEMVNVREARARLSELLARAARGEEIVIARAGVPVARLVAVEATPPRSFGTMSLTVPDGFFDALPDNELQRWE